MIKYRSGPGRCRVAKFAVRGESGLRVIRICGRLIFGQVASHACSRRVWKHSVDMARSAGDGRVGASQRKYRFTVIKCRRLPGRGVVAHLASLRDPGLCVVWVRCVLEIFQVATNASSR